MRAPFANPQAIRDFAVRLCSQLGRRLDDACPIADASTVEGVRVHAVIAPLVPQGAAISIRLPDAVAPSLESLAKNGMFPSKWMPLLEGFVLVTGGTGAGKTTLLKAMLMRCAPGERIITVEEVRELGMLDHDNRVSLVTRDANMEGKGAIGLSGNVHSRRMTTFVRCMSWRTPATRRTGRSHWYAAKTTTRPTSPNEPWMWCASTATTAGTT